MSTFSENITPDSFSGALFAVEGIRDACTVLNGPTGCKFYHSAISDSQFQRDFGQNLLVYGGEFYFGMSRIPATYLDGNDYVFSSREKLERLLQIAARQNHGLIAVINSPGAALIGDDLESFLAQTVKGAPWFALETAGFSGSFGAGYQKALSKAIDALAGGALAPGALAGGALAGGALAGGALAGGALAGGALAGGALASGAPARAVRPKTVNLLGLGIYQKYYEGNYAALRRLLGVCGIDVIAAPGAGDDAASFARLGWAALNVAVYPEYGAALAEKLRGDYGTPWLTGAEGPPLGFDSTSALVRQICAALEADPSPALAAIDRARARAYRFLARFSAMLGFPRGALFSVKAEAGTAYALTVWLSSYLGMIPAAISLTGEEETSFVPRLAAYLASIHRAQALTNPVISTPTHVLLGDGNTIAELRLEGQRFCGIEISLPSLGYIDVTEKSLLGEEGALFLLEQILNGLRYVIP
jgi:nitrogenase molybdenum-iron protein alpha/beta subunit